MTLYDADFYAWAEQQATLLRSGQLAQADIEHIAEEIESMGRREKRELLSRLAILLMHLLKWQAQPMLRGNSWRATIKVQRRDIARDLADNPSLKPKLPELLADAYGDATLLASRDTLPKGLGNDHDRVGRYFLQHPEIDSATLVAHDWRGLARLFSRRTGDGAGTRAGLFLSDTAQRRRHLLAWAATLHSDALHDPDYSLSVPGKPRAKPGESTLAPAIGRVGSRVDGPANPMTGGILRVRSRCEQAPNQASRVLLDAACDAHGVPRVRVDWRLSDDDWLSVRRANLMLAEELGRLGIGRLRLDPWLREPGGGWPAHLSGACHQMGTTRMSASPRDGVVDRNCRVHGIRNLYLAGSSVFPTVGCANPTLTLVALAARLASHLAGTR